MVIYFLKSICGQFSIGEEAVNDGMMPGERGDVDVIADADEVGNIEIMLLGTIVELL